MFRNRIRTGAVSAAVAAAALLVAAGPAQAAWVNADTGGVSVGQTVYVSVGGLAPDLTEVAVGQCAAVINGPNDCNLGGSLLGNADDQGNWQAGGVTLVGSVGGVDCTAAAGACTLAVTSLTDPNNILASVPLSFG